jgi:hypothetical protein
MLSLSLRWAVLSAAAPAILYLSAASAQAQSNSEEPTGNAAPALQYRSALADYRKFNDQAVAPWTEVNDTVGKIGGWRVYAKEAREPDPAAADKAIPSTNKNNMSEPAKAMSGSSMKHGAKP